MQKYAKKMIAMVCLFLASVLWYQSHNAVDVLETEEMYTPETVAVETVENSSAIDPQETEISTPSQSSNASWFTIACVPSHMARHGLDTDLRKRGLSQFTKNIEAQRPGYRSGSYRCYFRVNPEHIGCFNPQLITKDYLDENGYDATLAFPGGAPGQICYFKKEFANNYTNLMTILKRNGAVHDLNQHLVPSPGAAMQKLSAGMGE